MKHDSMTSAAQPDGLEDLRPGVGGDRRDAHLRHGLAHALAERLDQVRGGRGRVDAGDVAAGGEVLDGGHGQVRVHRGGPVAQQQRDVVHLAGVAGLGDEPDAGARALLDQVLVHRADQQQRRDRRVVRVDAAAGQHDEPRAVLDRRRDLLGDLREPPEQAGPTLGRREDAAHGVRGEPGVLPVVVDVDDLGELVVAQHRERQDHLATARRARVEQVLLRTQLAEQRGDQLLADRVQRRVRDLGEQLAEVVVERPRPRREEGERGVVAHRADRLRPGGGHRLEEDVELLLGVAERLLALAQRRGRDDLALARRQVVEVDQAGVQPVLVRLLGGQRALDLGVVDDAAGGGVDQEHAARLQPALPHHRTRRHVQHADLGGQRDEPVLGDPVPGRAQAVAVEHRADHGAVGEADQRGAVPRLHQRGVELVEGTAGRIHLAVVLPRLRDHHQHRVGQAAPAEVQQLEHLVEGRRVARVRGDDRGEPLAGRPG